MVQDLEVGTPLDLVAYSPQAGHALQVLDATAVVQPGNLFRLMKPDEKKRLIESMPGSLAHVPKDIQKRMVGHLMRADPAYGKGVAKALGLPVK